MAMIKSAVTNAIAQCTTLRRNTTSSDEITSSAANRKKIKLGVSMLGNLYCAATIQSAVTTIFISASGKSIFHPKRIT